MVRKPKFSYNNEKNKFYKCKIFGGIVRIKKRKLRKLSNNLN